MNATLAILVLAVLPPGLLVLAHLYAMSAQDKKAWCVVLLDRRVRSLDRVISEHQRQYRVVVIQEWDALTKGYRARIPVKYLDAIEHDRRVQVIQSWEQDEFLHVEPALAHADEH